MNRKILTALAAGIMGVVTACAAPAASAGDQMFSLSSGFDNSSDKYESGPWMLKLTAPAGLSVMKNSDPDMVRARTNGVAGNTQFGLGDTEAAASYNLYCRQRILPRNQPDRQG